MIEEEQRRRSGEPAPAAKPSPYLPFKPIEPPPPVRPQDVALSADIHERLQREFPGSNSRTLEAQWRAWLVKKELVPWDPDRHFFAFCRKRYQSVTFSKDSKD